MRGAGNTKTRVPGHFFVFGGTQRAMPALGLRHMQQTALRRLASPASQMAFRVGLAVQTEFRVARSSLGAYVRLLSICLHGVLRVLIPEAVMPPFFRVLTCQAKPEKPLRNAANVMCNCRHTREENHEFRIRPQEKTNINPETSSLQNLF